MDMRGLGEANIRKFFEQGFLSDIPGLYKLPLDEIAKQEGFKEKSIENLRKAIEKSKAQPLHRLIYALGIRFVGETTAKTVAQAISNLLELKDFSEEQLQSLEDIGPKVAGSIFHFFHEASNIEMLEELATLGLSLENHKKQTKGNVSLAGQTFLFTGTLPTLKRSDAEALAEENGGVIMSGVSSKLNYLVVGEEAGSKLEKAKKINTVSIISEAEFLAMLGKK